MKAGDSISRVFVSIALVVNLTILAPVVDVGHRVIAATAQGTNQPPPNTFYIPPKLGKIPGNLNTVEITPNYTTPRENLTKVANAIRISTYSLTTYVTVPSGLGLTQAVRILVRFNSYSGSAFSTVAEQLYNNASGNRLAVNDQEGLGTPREARFRIELFEYPPGWTGGRVLGTGAFDLPDMRVNLHPLYSVSVSPIKVSRIDECALLKSYDSRIRWFSPDNQQHETTFRLGTQTSIAIPGSEWRADEVNAARNYRIPAVGVFSFFLPSGSSNVNLIPAPLVAGRPMASQEIKQATRSDGLKCTLSLQYIISRQLRRIPPIAAVNTGAASVGGAAVAR